MLDFPKVTVTGKGTDHAKSGHPWVFEGEVTGLEGVPADGELVNVFSNKGRFLGTGYYNSSSKIRVRIISTNPNDRFDDEFYRRRVKYALDYRRTVMGDDFRNARLIFGEADGFPGLTVDLFEGVLVAQVLCLGVERIKDLLFEILCGILPDYGVEVRAVYERNDVKIRELEGMSQYKAYWRPERFGITDTDRGRVIIEENGIKYDVDYINGQKTGFFLDQKYNRAAAARIAKGKRVLDCFTHTGAFALNCLKGGAEHVVAVDISETALDAARYNAVLNGYTGDRISFVQADVFRMLTEMAESRSRDYDYIILDPPAFTKSSSTVKDAYRGYKDINYRAMKCLPRGGYLATCSCSHFMTDPLFRKMLDDAASDAAVSLRMIEHRAQSPDHPIATMIPETDYLKFYLFQVV